MRFVTLVAVTAQMIAVLFNVQASAQSLPSFPGAEGFGAVASGGRGGQVLFVDRLDADPQGNNGSGNSGSLNWALRQSGARTIVFRVSGVINGPAYVLRGNVTIAGQTSPGGVIVRGLECGVHYGGQNCDNLIVRYLRLRPACNLAPPGNCPHDDGLRLDGVKQVMIDHVSIANAEDEAVQLSWASDITIQNSIIAETVGGHTLYGGILMNYAYPGWPQDGISIVRNLFYRIEGRLPEINCESSAPDDNASLRSIVACQDRPLRLEVSNNYYFDAGYYITYAQWVGDAHDPADGPYRIHYNMVGNRFHARSGFPNYGMVEIAMLDNSDNSLYVSDNRINKYPSLQDYALFYCCNDFHTTLPAGNTHMGTATRRATRHPFPEIDYVSGDSLLSAVVPAAGARPHDPMDRRISASALSGTIPNLPYGQPVANDALDLDFSPNDPPAPPLDSDNDGMPDAFELAHGLNPNVPDNNGLTLSLPLLGVAGYTNLEVYLELLSRGGDPDRLFADDFEGG